MTQTVNWTAGQGETWSLSLTWKQSTGTPVDLTGYTARMQARETYGASSTVLSLTSGSGITLGGTAGTIAISVPASTTAAIGAATYVWDLEVVSGGSAVTRLVQGNLIVTPEVTR